MAIDPKVKAGLDIIESTVQYLKKGLLLQVEVEGGSKEDLLLLQPIAVGLLLEEMKSIVPYNLTETVQSIKEALEARKRS